MTLLERLNARADNAYCRYMDYCKRDPCLGWEIKVEKGIFGLAELEAHKAAAEMLGWHRAYHDVIKILREEASNPGLACPDCAGKGASQLLPNGRTVYFCNCPVRDAGSVQP